MFIKDKKICEQNCNIYLIHAEKNLQNWFTKRAEATQMVTVQIEI